ncbi:MAG: alpha/beta hydrolase-fold protein [Pseudomonadota bacterium]|nr:alpha/beta hydrolase-fold protein [Pseudomonadota bacterium]
MQLLNTLLLATLLLATLLFSPQTQSAPAANVALPTVASGRIQRLVKFASEHVPARNVDVWLPSNYPSAGKYAVLYMHDGQMLFDAGQTWNHQEWRADEVAGELIASGRTQPFIIVGIWNAGAERHSEYFPQKPYESLSRKQRRVLKKSNRDQDTPLLARRINSDRYLKFVVGELKPYIDKHFAVLRSPEHTFVMGSSMGALISLYALAEYPDVFGGAACLSTHWPGAHTLDDNPIPDAFLRYIGAHLPAAKWHRIYFDHGTATLDALYPALQARVDGLMRAKDYPSNLWQTRVFPAAEHSEKAWSERLHLPMEFLLKPAVDAD